MKAIINRKTYNTETAEKQGETRYFLSPFGTFGAVNMLKEVLCVEQGCKGCSI